MLFPSDLVTNWPQFRGPGALGLADNPNLAERWSTPIWCRSAKFSSSRAARERRIEGRVASSVARKLSIGKENYEKDKPHTLTQIEVFERHNGRTEIRAGRSGTTQQRAQTVIALIAGSSPRSLRVCDLPSLAYLFIALRHTNLIPPSALI